MFRQFRPSRFFLFLPMLALGSLDPRQLQLLVCPDLLVHRLDHFRLPDRRVALGISWQLDRWTTLDNAASCDCEILRNTNAMHLDSLRFVHFDFVCTLRPPQQGGSTDTYKWRQALSMADTARTDTPDATHDSRQLHSFPRQRNKKWTYMDGWTCFALACSCHSQGHRGSRGLCDCA